MPEVEITGETLDNLAQKLETFSESLSPEERTTLQAMLVLAGQKIADADEVSGFSFGGSPFAPTNNVNVGGMGQLQQGFSNSFGSFTGSAARGPVGGGGIVAVTVCIE